MIAMVLIELTLISVAYVAFTTVTQRLLTDFRKNYEMQEKVKVKQKELMDLAKSNADTKTLNEKQAEMSKLMMESLPSSMKPLIVLLPASYLLYYQILPRLFPTNPVVTLLASTVNYKYYFILVTVVLGLIMSIGVLLRDRAVIKKEKAAAARLSEAAQAKPANPY